MGGDTDNDDELGNKKIKWEIRALIIGLIVSVVANAISIPKAIFEIKLSDIEKKQLELDIGNLKIEKDSLTKENDISRKLLDERTKIIDKLLGGYDSNKISQLKIEIVNSSNEANSIRQTAISDISELIGNANKKIIEINNQVRKRIIQNYQVVLNVGAIVITAYDFNIGSNRAIEASELNDKDLGQIRFYAWINDKRYKVGDSIKELSIAKITKNAVVFEVVREEFPEEINFTLSPNRMLIGDMEAYLNSFPELRVKK
jgi:hypothetical protein